MNKNIKAIIYVSAWIITWIAFSSVINAGLIAVNLYAQTDKGPLITFFISATIFLGGAISLYKEVFPRE